MSLRLHHIIDHLYNIFLENYGSENCVGALVRRRDGDTSVDIGFCNMKIARYQVIKWRTNGIAMC